MSMPTLPDPPKNNDAQGSPLPPHEPFFRKTNFWLAVLMVLILIIIIQHFPRNHGPKTPPIPVITAVARSANVPVYLSQLGTVTATYTVTVKTRISGELLRVLFKEGQAVKAGELLAEIDPRPFQAQLTQFEGQLIRDQALLVNALIDLKRYKTLWRQDSVAQQTLATQESLVKQYEGAVKFDQGQIETIKINLLYCQITAPMDGRVGLRLVDPGNFVQPSDTTGLMVINTMNPITVIFSMPQDNIAQVMTQINAGHELIVKAYDRQQNKLLAIGTLLTVDNQIDTTTGMVKLRANFNNDQNRLFPNQFVNVELEVTTLPKATVIPTAAIQRGPQGNFAFVLNADKTVSIKPITTDVVSGNDTVITQGVLPGQSVVVEGSDKLIAGSSVIIANPIPRAVT